VKAFLLAAGLGTRLRPLTNKIPKCLVKVYGKPLLEWWIILFEQYGISEVLINLHHLPAQVKMFVENYPTDVKFTFSYENKLLGSAGTLIANKNFVDDENEFFIFYSDNLTNYNLTNFLNFHRNHTNNFSMALFRTNDPKSKGIAVLDEDNTIIEFEEKPKNPKSDLANAGIYIASPYIFHVLPKQINDDILDIGFNLLPKLVGEMSGWETDGYLIDIGTHKDLKKAEKEWPQIVTANNYRRII